MTEEIEAVQREPRPQELYRHFRGKLYQIVTLAKDSETGETAVVYQALYPPYGVWVRKLSDFCARLEPSRYPDAEQRFRFERVLSGEESGDGEARGRQAPPETEKAALETDESRPDAGTVQPVPGEPQPVLDPMLEKFLDSASPEERLNILMALRGRITDEMIDTMAIACGLEIEPGDISVRWNDLRECLLTIDRYEQSRSRFE
ncbi:DUF1653 domain-containing protein [Lachnoclostridium sp. Marseille-P6806]|uniref:DUF1653 domain-containing protein n=1 Tax=Lachnoclostridium sp. Marseille-P6806 TaxID=2364793 RepID=UPI001030DA6D|nr:DUF1653 domain-containing protein [Lachnoclostridium sp. Marseille-P6806]